MEAARVPAIRGHQVDLCESGKELGGVVITGGMPDFKKDDHALIAWYEDQLKDLGVKVQVNTKIDADAIAAAKADTVIIATGATAKMLFIPGAKNVFSATDVLLGKADPGETVLIVRGGLVGCEIALWLTEKGKHVTIVEVMGGLLQLAGPLCHANGAMLLELLHFKKVDVITRSKVVEERPEGFVIEPRDGGQSRTVKADSAIIAIGYNPETTLYNQVKDETADIHIIGDAQQVQNIMYAIWGAYEVARNI